MNKIKKINCHTRIELKGINNMPKEFLEILKPALENNYKYIKITRKDEITEENINDIFNIFDKIWITKEKYNRFSCSRIAYLCEFNFKEKYFCLSINTNNRKRVLKAVTGALKNKKRRPNK